MRVKLSYFSEQDGNAMTLEVKIRQLVLLSDWPVILISESDEALETCNDEQELRATLRRRGL